MKPKKPHSQEMRCMLCCAEAQSRSVDRSCTTNGSICLPNSLLTTSRSSIYVESHERVLRHVRYAPRFLEIAHHLADAGRFSALLIGLPTHARTDPCEGALDFDSGLSKIVSPTKASFSIWLACNSLLKNMHRCLLLRRQTSYT